MSACNPVVPVCNNTSFCTVGGTLHWDGALKCLTVSTTPMADGWVTGFLVRNNCVIDYSYAAPDCRTIAAACAPTPADCAGAGGANNSDAISGDPANMTTLFSGELLTRLYSQGGGGITVTGAGTAFDPQIISYTVPTQSLAISGEAPLKVVGSGLATDPAIISWNRANKFNGIANGVQYDAGIAIDFVEESTPIVRSIIAGNAMNVVSNGQGVYTVGVKDVALELVGEHIMGPKIIELDLAGRIIAIRNNPDWKAP